MRIINFKNITFQFTLYLFIFAFISLLDHILYGTDGTPKSYYFTNIGLISGIFVFWYYLLKAFKSIQLNVLNLTITGIILFLLIHPITPWYYVVITAFITLLFKMFVRYKGSPIFNPANCGLFVAYYITYIFKQLGVEKETLFISWWGGDLLRDIWEQGFLYIVPIFLLSGFIYFVWKFRKSNHALAFTLTYLGATTLMFLSNGVEDIMKSLYTMTVSALAYLILVMVSEPKTSPIKPLHQITLGIAGGLITFWTTFYLPVSWRLFSEIDPFVLGLVILNVLTFATKYVSNRKPIVAPAIKPATPNQVSTPTPSSVAQ